MTGAPLAAPVPIGPGDDCAGFSCGNAALDAWLKETAAKSEGRTARTYVVCDGRTVVGYYCLATGAVGRAAAPGRLSRNAPDPVPVMVIGRLAVDAGYQGRGLGGAMLRDGLLRVLQAAEIVGVRAVLVHAIDDSAASFYGRYGFAAFPDAPRTLYLPIETIRLAV